MLGLASISERIQTLEQTLQRAAHPPQQLQQLQLNDAVQPAAAANAAAAAPSPAAATVLSQLTQLSSAFQHILSLDVSLREHGQQWRTERGAMQRATALLHSRSHPISLLRLSIVVRSADRS